MEKENVIHYPDELTKKEENAFNNLLKKIRRRKEEVLNSDTKKLKENAENFLEP